ncbi:hypothetical protein WEI85_39450 [Actinomycetes bacterium KLBMP 9797]
MPPSRWAARAVAYHLSTALRADGDLAGARAHLAVASGAMRRFDSAPQWIAMMNMLTGLIEAAEGNLAAARPHPHPAVDRGSFVAMKSR